MQKRIVSIALAAIVVASPMLMGTQAGTIDPCADEIGAATDGTHICLDGETIAIAPKEASDAKKTVTEYTTVVTANVTDNGRWGTIQNKTGSELLLSIEEWTPLLPSGPSAENESTSEEIVKAHLLLPMNPRWHEQLSKAGVDVISPLGGNWYAVNATEAESGWESAAFIEATQDFDTKAQFSERLNTAQGRVNVTVLAQPPNATGAELAESAFEEHGATNITTRHNLGVLFGNVSSSEIHNLADESSVIWVEEAPTEWKSHNDNARDMTGAKAVHDHESGDFTGNGINTVITDFNMATGHQELKSSLLSSGVLPGEETDKVGSGKHEAHGTMVGGTLLADGEDGEDVTEPLDVDDQRLEGIAPNSTYIFSDMDPVDTTRPGETDNGPDHFSRYVRVDRAKSEYPTTESLVTAISPETGQAASAFPTKYDLLSYQMDRIVSDHSVQVYQSSGNDGPQNMSSEGAAKNIVTVGGVQHQNTDRLSDDRWSDGDGGDPEGSTGPTAGGQIKPDLVAPNDDLLTPSTTSLEDTYTEEFTGTSAAAPIVGGAGALTEEMYEDGVFRNETGDVTQEDASPSLVKATLANTANSYDKTAVNSAIGDGPRHMRDVQGWGAPDVSEMYTHGRFSVTVNEDYSLLPGSMFRLTYDLPDDDPDGDGHDEQNIVGLKVSLAWTEPPTPPPAHRLHEEAPHNRTNNDLDLIVKAPDGTEYLGNEGLVNDGASKKGGKDTLHSDRNNTLENVFVDVQDTSEWTVTVKAKNLDAMPADTRTIGQDFGLIVRPVRGSVECCSDTIPNPYQPPDPTIDLDHYFDSRIEMR